MSQKVLTIEALTVLVKDILVHHNTNDQIAGIKMKLY